MSFNTKDCEWKSVELNILGRKFTGLRGFEINKQIEKEYLYGSGDKPLDISSGNQGFPLTFTMLKFELDLLNDAAQAAAYNDITEVPSSELFAYIQFVPKGDAQRRFISVNGFEFTELKYAQSQGDKMMEIAMPGLALGMTTGLV